MATDMAKHAKLLEKFKKRVSITLNSKKDEKNNNIDSMMLSSFGYNFDNQNDRTVKNHFILNLLNLLDCS